ncbi:DNA-binding response regulator [Phocaeicola vulgatus]|nr:DNA-binding response regulator [Phocaeicola vulgatus]
MKDIFAEDYWVLVAENGREAWESIRKNGVDIVVSDIMMPEMDGMELCRHIKNDIATSHIIVVLLTAQISMENEIASYELGADDYVSKPFEPNVLKVHLKNLLKKRKQIQANFKSNPSIGMISKIDFTSLDEQLIEKAIKVVERNLSDPEFNVVALASELGMSRSTLARKIKGITGRTPLDFIKDIKMKHACQMLKNKRMSIAEMVIALGYNDHKYFATSFREVYGMTPSEYQKKVEEIELI